MKTFTGMVTIVGSFGSMLLLFDAMLAKTAMLQLVNISLAMAITVIPYCVYKVFKGEF